MKKLFLISTLSMLSFTAQGAQGPTQLGTVLVTDKLDKFMSLYKQINNNPNFELYPAIL